MLINSDALNKQTLVLEQLFNAFTSAWLKDLSSRLFECSKIRVEWIIESHRLFKELHDLFRIEYLIN